MFRGSHTCFLHGCTSLCTPGPLGPRSCGEGRPFTGSTATECSRLSLNPPDFQSNDNQVLWELMGGPPKTRNMSACWQDGRFFAENETWVVDSCTRCTCKVRPAACAPRPLALAGQPALAGRRVWGSESGRGGAEVATA